MAQPARVIQPGTVLGGKYQVERVLGQGGMGCVVAAIHLQLGQRVAIKFLLPEAMAVKDAVERFLREARAAVRLRSEHVGRVIDVGQFDDGAPYMVMEFLEGHDLAQQLHAYGALTIPTAVDLVLQACEAIAEAHSLGIVHRDLKPANLFLTRKADGSPLIKVLDFGISKANQADASFNLTRTATVMGSPGYMSPEQLRSARDCDARSDIWSLGVILYELVCARPPFSGESITELALHIAIDPTPAMNVPNAPPGFEQAVGKCLAKDAPDRYQNVAEMAQALAPYGSESTYEAAQRVSRVLGVAATPMPFTAVRPATAPVGGHPFGPTPTTSPSTPQTGHGGSAPIATTGADVEPPKGRGGLIAVIAVLLIAGGGAGIFFATRGGGDNENKAANPPAAIDAAPAAKVVIDAGVVEPAAAIDAAAAVAPAVDAAVVEPKPEPKPEPKRKPPKKRPPRGTGDEEEDISNSRY